MRRRMIVLALLTVLVGVGLRGLLTTRADLGPSDLRRFEEDSGIDLPDAFGDMPFFLLWTRGDGQAFVALAADLDLDGPAQRLMLPSYRYSRVGYAWLGRLLALGRVRWVPVGLMVVNLLALAGVGALTARMVHRFGERSYLVLVNPGLYIGFASDSAEPLGLLLLMVALLAGSGWVAGLAAGLLGTVRPSYGLALPTRGRNIGLIVGSVVGGVAGIRLIAQLSIQDHTMPIGTVVVPMTGYLDTFADESAGVVAGAAVLLIAVLATALVGGLRRSGAIRVAWITNALLLLSLGTFVLYEPFNWLRAAAVLPLLWSLPATSLHGEA